MDVKGPAIEKLGNTLNSDELFIMPWTASDGTVKYFALKQNGSLITVGFLF
jgi:hypothetical protein